MIICGFVTTSETYYYIILHITLKYLTCCFIKILIHLQTVSYILYIILFDFTKATIFDSHSVFMVTSVQPKDFTNNWLDDLHLF